MTSPFIDLLKQLASGIYIFEPFYRSGRELQEFQTTVERLQEMKELGLVQYVWLQKRDIAGCEYYDMAVVRGGLTEEGERVLAEHLLAHQQTAQKK